MRLIHPLILSFRRWSRIRWWIAWSYLRYFRRIKNWRSICLLLPTRQSTPCSTINLDRCCLCLQLSTRRLLRSTLIPRMCLLRLRALIWRSVKSYFRFWRVISLSTAKVIRSFRLSLLRSLMRLEIFLLRFSLLWSTMSSKPTSQSSAWNWASSWHPSRLTKPPRGWVLWLFNQRRKWQ